MKKAIILLHGFLSDQSDFDPIMPDLETRYDYIERFVYPGHHDDESYENFNDEETFFRLEKCFEQLLKKYPIVDVIGYSMGGALGVYLSQKYAFRKLVLLAPANKYFNIFLPYAKLKHYARNFVSLEKAIIQKNDQDKTGYRIILSHTLEEDKESLRFLYERYLHSYFLTAFKNFRRLIKKANRELKTINNPCFIAWGEVDQLVPKKTITFLAAKCTHP
ncbi:MAG TPA: alpha/beta hydrolase, partial [Bacilli bacterium]|nr:alpha/beta hydrolase [Bacilli bacterium]